MEKYKKEIVDYSYAIGRKISEIYVKRKWHPIIINAEAIPQNGPLILCGNHLHKHDQFPVMCATKRTIHWMAKDEYFKDKKSAPVMRMMGCIRVEREKGKIDTSKEIAMDYLRKGSAVGIFPEGTRNVYQIALKKLVNNEQSINALIKEKNITEEYKQKLAVLEHQHTQYLKELEEAKQTIISKGNNVVEDELLLPFKFGAISMAEHTGAQIVPFAVTGDYTENNDNLMVRFGEAYHLKTNNYHQENEELRERIKSLLIQNYKEKGYR